MYRTSVNNVKNPRVSSRPVKKNNSNSASNSEDSTSSRKFELLWRKKTTKVHKTWEGDAVGTLVNTLQGYELVVYRDGSHIATIKLKSTPILNEGTILSSGSYEFEVGGILSNQKLPEDCDTVLDKTKVEHTERLNKKLKSEKLRSSVSSGTSLGLLLYPTKVGLTPFKIPLKEQDTKPTPKSSNNNEGAQIIDPILASKLRPHQEIGVKFIMQSVLGERHNHGYGCILADEMGLGKTLTSIAAIHTLLRNDHIQNALIVCPVTLTANWKQEFEKWFPISQQIRPRLGIMTIDPNGLGNGSLKDPIKAFFSDRQFKTHQVMIVGYERIRLLSIQVLEMFKTFDLVICDEGHRLKSSGSKTSEAMSNICGEKRIILTGTPIQNGLDEFWALSDFVNPGIFGSEARFHRKYSIPISSYLTVRPNSQSSLKIENDYQDNEIEIHDQVDVDNPSKAAADEALNDLTEICEEFMLRRTASTIEQYISVPKTEYIVFCRQTYRQAQYYEALVRSGSDLISSGQSIDSAACLKAISELRKAASGNKVDIGGKLNFLSALMDLIYENTDEKLVVVSGSTRVLDMCQQLCANKTYAWLRLDGSTPQDKRQSSVNIFNSMSRKRAFIFLLSTRSGGMGLNLIGGSRLVLLDCDWNPAIDAQVMARIHRDGQTRPCFIYRLLSTGTIDEKIFQRQLSKLGLSNNILLDVKKAGKADFSLETLRDLFTMSNPQKCNTLEVAGKNESLNSYVEPINTEAILTKAIDITGNVSCILEKKYNETE